MKKAKRSRSASKTKGAPKKPRAPRKKAATGTTRKRAVVDGVIYTISPKATAVSPLRTHLASVTAQSARYDRTTKSYKYELGGRTISCGGLINMLRAKYYHHYQDNRSKRAKTCKIKGSSSSKGKCVDRQIAKTTAGKKVSRMSPLTKGLLEYWSINGHVLEAAQVPVELPGWFKMTQADVITRHMVTGQLWLWEVKTGAPVGFHVKQGKMTGGTVISDIDCTKLNIWHLQLHHTKMALEAAGVKIAHANVIQIHELREPDAPQAHPTLLKVHQQPEWVKRLKF